MGCQAFASGDTLALTCPNARLLRTDLGHPPSPAEIQLALSALSLRYPQAHPTPISLLLHGQRWPAVQLQIIEGGQTIEIRRAVVGQIVIECAALTPWEVGCGLLVAEESRVESD